MKIKYCIVYKVKRVIYNYIRVLTAEMLNKYPNITVFLKLHT